MKEKRFIDETKLRQIVADSKSYAEVIKKFGYNPLNGSTYRALHKAIEKYKINTSHFAGRKRNEGNVNMDKYNSTTKRISASIKLRDLILLRGRECENCHLTMWQGREIPLQTHHIDGNLDNNVLENLQLLCPNCHAITENYGIKNWNKTVSEEELVEALKSSPNIRQALIKVGLTGKGKNYDRCYNLIYKYNIEHLKSK